MIGHPSFDRPGLLPAPVASDQLVEVELLAGTSFDEYDANETAKLFARACNWVRRERQQVLRGAAMLMRSVLMRAALLMGIAALQCGCIEVETRLRVNDDSSVSVKTTMKIDPQYEAMVLPEFKKELPKKLPPGVRVDFSQRIDGKAAVVIEAEGAPADALLKEDGSISITVSDGGFMKKRYEYREVVKRAVEVPVPIRLVVTLPGSIESLSGGQKTAGDTVEFDQSNAKPGNVYAATSTAFAFAFGSDRATAAQVARSDAIATPLTMTGSNGTLIAASVASILAGVALLTLGWVRSRRADRDGSRSAVAAIPAAQLHTPGADVAHASIFCSECGAPNTAGRRFCGKCGHALE